MISYPYACNRRSHSSPDGVYGINTNRSSGSIAWPWRDTKAHKLQYGIAISMWNQNETQRGLFTNATMRPLETEPPKFTNTVLKPFNSGSRTSIMNLTSGKQKQLITPANEEALKDYTSIVLEYYAMKDKGKIDLDL